jgi:PAS domain S-box-containing protein
VWFARFGLRGQTLCEEFEMLGEESSVLTEGPLIWGVDDDPALLEVMRGLLEEAGYRFEGFLSGAALVEGLSSSEEQPELLLLDMMMPGMSGQECLRAVRAMRPAGVLPVLVVTAMTSESMLINAFEAGADDVLHKPFGYGELMARIKLQLSRARMSRASRQRCEDLQQLYALAVLLAGAQGAEEVVRGVERASVTLLATELCRIYAPRDGGRCWQRVGAAGVLLLDQLPEASELVGRRRPVLLTEQEARIGGLGEGYRSAALYPMVRGDEGLVGVLALGGVQGERGHRIAGALAELGAAALGRLMGQAQQGVVVGADRARAFLENVVWSCPDAIVAAGRDGRIVVFNPAAERILGWSRGEALGMDVRRLYPEDGAREIMRQMREEAHGGAGRLERWRGVLVDRRGQEIPVLLSAAILYDEETGAEAGSVGVFTDLRPRLELESQLAQAEQEVERSRQQVVVAELAGAAAHELNQPLTALMARAELLPRLVPGLNEQAMRALDGLLGEAERIAQIVRRLGQMTQYRTRAYVGGSRIMDLGDQGEEEEG